MAEQGLSLHRSADQNGGAAEAELQQTLERTGYRASLVPQYAEGHAPDRQRKEGNTTPPTYYDLPAIKKPEWKWMVPAYFFLGGLSSGAYIVAALVDLTGGEEERVLRRAGRYLQFAALLPCPVLLIADLGRPERFHHMLRVFRPRSMMNQGSWALSIYGLFSGAAVAAQLAEDLAPGGRLLRFVRLPLRAFMALGIVPAAYIGSYTGVLLSATNVPLWAGNRYWMGPLFFTSALSAGMAGTQLAAKMLGPVSEASEERLELAENITLAAELAITAASAIELAGLSKPLRAGRMATLYQIGALGLGTVLPLALGKAGKRAPWIRLLRSALALAGSAITKYTITEAGKQSADDPRAYFEYTRPKP